MTRQERRAAKKAARERIAELQGQIVAATNKVPKRVLDGYHNEAVNWKRRAVAARTQRIFKTTGATLSLIELEMRVNYLKNYLEKLT